MKLGIVLTGLGVLFLLMQVTGLWNALGWFITVLLFVAGLVSLYLKQ